MHHFEEDSNDEDLTDDIPTVKLSEEEKIGIRTPLLHSLIIKPYSKSLKFRIFDYKIRKL